MAIPVATRQIVAWTEIKARNGVAAVFPVDQIVGLQDRHPGEREHGGRNHVVCGIHQYDIWVREVGGYHRICEGSIAVVAAAFLAKSARRQGKQ